MNDNSLRNNNTSNTIEVYVYDDAPDGRPILKSKSENNVCVKNTITSSYESIQSADEDYLQCDGYTARKSYVAKISYNDNESHKSQDSFIHTEPKHTNPITSYSIEHLIIKSKDVKEAPSIEDEECGNCSCMGKLSSLLQ